MGGARDQGKSINAESWLDLARRAAVTAIVWSETFSLLQVPIQWNHMIWSAYWFDLRFPPAQNSARSLRMATN
jgi:hypothetical protein